MYDSTVNRVRALSVPAASAHRPILSKPTHLRPCRQPHRDVHNNARVLIIRAPCGDFRPSRKVSLRSRYSAISHLKSILIDEKKREPPSLDFKEKNMQYRGEKYKIQNVNAAENERLNKRRY